MTAQLYSINSLLICVDQTYSNYAQHTRRNGRLHRDALHIAP